MGWGVSTQDGVFLYRMECSYTGCDVRIQDGELVYGMGC